MRVSVIIPAAGSSKRMGAFRKRKPFILLGGKPVLAYTLGVFKKINAVKEIILVVNKKDLSAAKRHFGGRAAKIIKGGARRSVSVYNGIKALDKNCDIILIHDAVRPFVTKDIVMRSINAAARFGAAVAAVPVIPTIKSSNKNGFVKSTLNRKSLWEIQTPQAFRKDIIKKAFAKFGSSGDDITDDAMLVEKAGCKVKLVMGSYRNIKITTPVDMAVAKALLGVC